MEVELQVDGELKKAIKESGKKLTTEKIIAFLDRLDSQDFDFPRPLRERLEG